MKSFTKNGILLFILSLFFFSKAANSQSTPIYQNAKSIAWADSMLNTLSYKEKIGQLFMIEAFSNKDQAHVNQVVYLIDSFYVGGLIFFQGGPYRQVALNNYYQARSKVKLLIGIDGEWGLSMRLDSTIRFPRQMTLSAANSPDKILEMGLEIGRQCKRVGIHVNFAPDIDINNNPANPVINSRSFGENKDQVALLGSMYMKGMQRNGIIACGKHFPGHGNTDTDSHFSLPIVHGDMVELDSVELMPFKKLINDSLGSVMVAHLSVPAIDSTPDFPSTLSKKIVTDLLINKMGFQGLIFTDALNMKAAAKAAPTGQLEVMALQAGNDILLNCENIPRAVESIHFAIQNCELEQSEIDYKVRKILMAKYWCGLDNYIPLDTTNLYADLNPAAATYLNAELYEKSPALLRNKGRLIPLKTFYKDGIASLVINDTLNNNFQQFLNRYSKVDQYMLPKDASKTVIDSTMKLLSKYDRVVVSLHNTTTNASKNFNLTENILSIIEEVVDMRGTILCVFGNPYVLGKINIDKQKTLIAAFEDTYFPQFFTAQKLFGASEFEGRLPVSTTAIYKEGIGISPMVNNVLNYSYPEKFGVQSFSLSQVDSIVKKAIADSIFPGCQILAIKNNNVVYNKSFGYHTYDKTRAVNNDDLYDIASITKIASTALAAMKLVENDKLNLDNKASYYLHELKKSNKKDITIRELMTHQAGLQAWIPFWKSTVDANGLKSSIYKNEREDNYTTQVADSIFILDSYKDSIWNEIVESPVEPVGKYVYSDLGLLILQHVIEKITGKDLEAFVTDSFYKPMGLWRLGYHPLTNFSPEVIVPTENDIEYRKQLIRGFVHDPASAMLGGATGHAGVFSNAQSLAIIMQMLLNDGEYGGKKYFKYETIDLFTSQIYPGTPNRRGLLFDKPDENTKNTPTAKSASCLTFGHTGFTGTCAWADPLNDLVFIFLSNRVNPSAANNKLAKQNIRTDIMEIFYNQFDKNSSFYIK